MLLAFLGVGLALSPACLLSGRRSPLGLFWFVRFVYVVTKPLCGTRPPLASLVLCTIRATCLHACSLKAKFAHPGPSPLTDSWPIQEWEGPPTHSSPSINEQPLEELD